ncbi:MAG TPA: serine/threonine-protein kinase, partial [Polyangiaceae bacterium]
MKAPENKAPARVIGRYALHAEIAAGGMATVHIGRLLGPVGFSRMVAIKRMHPQMSKDPEFVSMFLDEARLVARIRHPNVVPTLDVVATQEEVFLVMDYVQGESLSRLIRAALQKGLQIPPRIVATILSGTLHGLHAAHEARNERGEPLGIVHRDISPQNILVGTDGVARVLDFGVAKASGRMQTTRDGQLKGKLAYMAPEQYSGQVTRQSDIYAASVVLWEALAGKRLFAAETEAAIMSKVLGGVVLPPSDFFRDTSLTLSSAEMSGIEMLDKITLRGLDRDPEKRFATAREMALSIERSIGLASTSEVGEWVEEWAAEALGFRAACIAEIESAPPIEPEAGAAMIGSTPKIEVVPASTDPTRASRAPLVAREAPGDLSQMSSISVSKPGEPERPPGVEKRTALVVLLVAIGTTAVFALLATLLVLRITSPRSSASSSSAEPSTGPLVVDVPPV